MVPFPTAIRMFYARAITAGSSGGSPLHRVRSAATKFASHLKCSDTHEHRIRAEHS